MSEKKWARRHRISIWGIILVLLGVGFLLENFDLLPWRLWDILWRLWPVILIIVGLDAIIDRRNSWL